MKSKKEPQKIKHAFSAHPHTLKVHTKNFCLLQEKKQNLNCLKCKIIINNNKKG